MTSLNISNILNFTISAIKKYWTPIIVIITVFFSFFFFQKTWINLCDNILVTPIMSPIYDNENYTLLNTLSITYALIILIYYRLIIYKERVFNKQRIVFTSIFTIIYILCLISGEWNYSLIPNTTLAYSHICFLIPILELIQAFRILNKKKKYEPESELKFEIENTECLRQSKDIKIKQKKDTKHRSQFTKKHANSLETENTLNNTKKDLFQNDTYNRIGHVKACATILNSSFFKEQSFALAITGSWGSGKTSFLNGLKEKMKKDNKDLIFINYNPWKCDTPQTIIKSFFDIYRSTIGQYIPTLSSKIDKYVFELLGQSNSISVQVLSKMGTLFVSDRENNTDQYETIKKELKQAKLKTVIIIDDLDRLEGNEIFEVCRLIRNTANFPYIQFLVSFEKEYIIRSLNKKRISNPNQYLEKIFNLEIPLSKIPEQVICSNLYKYLKNALSKNELFPEKNNNALIQEIQKSIFVIFHKDYDHANFKRSPDFFPSRNSYLIPKILKTNRDIIRYNNSFMLLIAFYVKVGMINEINLIDLFYLELIRYHDFKQYEKLKNNPLQFPGMQIKNDCYYYFNTTIGSKNNSDKIFYTIMNILFPGRKNQTDSKMNTLINLRNYDKYFLYNSDTSRISLSDFLDLDNRENPREEASKLHKKKPNEFKLQINETLKTITNLYEQKKISSAIELCKPVCSVIKKISTVIDPAFRHEITKGVSFSMEDVHFYSTNQLKYFLDMVNTLDLTGYSNSLKVLLLKLLNLSLLFKHLNNPNDQKEAIKIVEEFLRKGNNYVIPDHDSKNSNILLFSQAIDNTVKDFRQNNFIDTQLTLSYSDLLDIQISYFYKYSEKLDSICGYQLFGLCIESVDKNSPTHLSSKAIKIMLEYIQQNPKKYDDIFVIKTPKEAQYIYSPEIYYLQIFKSNENFENFILKHSELQIPKIKKFWEAYKNNNYKNIKKIRPMPPKKTNANEIIRN